MKKHEMVNALLKAGWDAERVPELEDKPFFEIKKLWIDHVKKGKRLEFAEVALGAATPEQQKTVLHWGSGAIDELMTVSKRAGLDPTRKGDLLRTSTAILAGMVAHPQERKEHPVLLARQAVDLAVFLMAEVYAQLNPGTTGGSSGTTGSDG